MFSEEGLATALGNLAKGWDSEVRAKSAVLSARASGKPWPPGQREQFILSMSSIWASQEYRARAIAASADVRRGKKESQEIRDRRSASALRAYAEGRKTRVNPKLTEADVLAIRAEYRWGMARELAARYGVSPQLIQDVAARRRWKDVA